MVVCLCSFFWNNLAIGVGLSEVSESKKGLPIGISLSKIMFYCNDLAFEEFSGLLYKLAAEFGLSKVK